jgi:hypothetical protein
MNGGHDLQLYLHTREKVKRRYVGRQSFSPIFNLKMYKNVLQKVHI